MEQPLDSPPLSNLAQGKINAVIVVDDLTRPTPLELLLPLIFEQLEKGGIRRSSIQILVGGGAHPPLSTEEIKRKLGQQFDCGCTLLTHDARSGCSPMGRSMAGTPYQVNTHVLHADLRICVGSILPHNVSGFGGGAKLLVPGVAGIETILQFHQIQKYIDNNTLKLKKNASRAFMEDAAKQVPLDFIVNVVVNPDRSIAGLFCGDFVAAHREGSLLAKKVYATRAPHGVDVAVLNAYPKDNSFYQCTNGINVLRSSPHRVLHKDGTTVFCSAASQGMGEHALFGPDGPLHDFRTKRIAHGLGRHCFYSPNVTSKELNQWSLDGKQHFETWDKVSAHLHSLYGDRASVAVFPCATMQLIHDAKDSCAL